MTAFRPLILATAVAALCAGAATSQNMDSVLEARHGLMLANAMNLGVLGGMAQGKVDYDAERAQTAADNLAAIGMIHTGFLWPEGSAAGEVEDSAAKPEIWANMDDFMAKWDAFAAGAAEVQTVAGDGQEALAAAFPKVGATCGGCHKPYRVPDN